MFVFDLLKSNKRFRASFFTMALALFAIFSIVLAMFQVTAWFKGYQTATTPAMLTNFETKTEYSLDQGSTWDPLPDDGAVVIDGITVENSSLVFPVSDLRLQISYKGKSAAFLRTSLFATFENIHTETVLPQPSSFLDISGDSWMLSEPYAYYKTLLGDEHNPDQLLNNVEDSFKYLPILTYEFDTTALNNAVSAHQDYKCTLYIKTETVQPDRYNTFWSLNELPFEIQ